MKDLSGMHKDEIRAFMKELGEPAYRGDQIFEWIHRHRATDFDAMTNLPLPLRERLAEKVRVSGVKPKMHQVDPGDGTRKYLLELADDGETVEAVLMAYRHGWSLCVSSQVGCRMGCRFCASTLDGKARDLTPGEMMGQVLAAQKDLDADDERLASIVVMGMGEPLENYDSLVKFLELVHDPDGLNIGYRHITVSTVGLVPGIYKLADEGIPITLAVSLHAPNDYIRSRIMPINVRYPVADLIAACRHYGEKTRRRISFEYIMIDGVNDHPELARELAGLLKGILCHINLIPMNPVAERPYMPSPPQRIDRFRDILRRHGHEVTVRRTLGRDIDAACGQLRRRQLLGEGRG